MTSLLGYLVSVNEYQPCLDIFSSQQSYTVGCTKDANYFCIDEPFIGIVVLVLSALLTLTHILDEVHIVIEVFWSDILYGQDSTNNSAQWYEHTKTIISLVVLIVSDPDQLNES